MNQPENHINVGVDGHELNINGVNNEANPIQKNENVLPAGNNHLNGAPAANVEDDPVAHQWEDRNFQHDIEDQRDENEIIGEHPQVILLEDHKAPINNDQVPMKVQSEFQIPHENLNDEEIELMSILNVKK